MRLALSRFRVIEGQYDTKTIAKMLNIRVPNSIREFVAALTILLIMLGVGIASDQGSIVLFLGLIGGLGVMILIFQRPAIGAGIILALAPLEGALMVSGHSFIKLITILCVVLLFVRIGATRQGIKVDLTTMLVLLFVFWSFTTILWSPDQEGSLSKWVSFAFLSSLYIILLNFVQSREDLKLALWGHILGGFILAIILINDLATSDFLRKGEVAGLGINLAARLVGLNVLLSLLLYQLETRTLLRAILLGTLVISIIGTVVSLSRGAWFGVVLSTAALVIVYAINGRLQIKPARLLWLLVAGFASFYFLNTFIFNEHGISKLTTRYQDGITFSDNAGGRFDIWIVGRNMFADAPLWGHGFESFANKFSTYAESGAVGGLAFREDKSPHNSFIGVSAQLGLIGFGLFIAVLASVFQKAWSLYSEKQVNIPALAWVSSLIVFLIIANSVDYAIDRKYLWYILGLITLIGNYLKDDQATKLPSLKQAG